MCLTLDNDAAKSSTFYEAACGSPRKRPNWPPTHWAMSADRTKSVAGPAGDDPAPARQASAAVLRDSASWAEAAAAGFQPSFSVTADNNNSNNNNNNKNNSNDNNNIHSKQRQAAAVSRSPEMPTPAPNRTAKNNNSYSIRTSTTTPDCLYN